MKPRFLLDENARRKSFRESIRQYNADLDIIAVGDPDSPAIGTKDSELLLYCEAHQRLLITRDRASMPTHIAAHLAAGHHHWGVFRLRKGYTLGDYIREIQLLWAASEAEEWLDQDAYIPW
jgi:hypothetical protein